MTPGQIVSLYHRFVTKGLPDLEPFEHGGFWFFFDEAWNHVSAPFATVDEALTELSLWREYQADPSRFDDDALTIVEVEITDGVKVNLPTGDE